MGAPRQLWQGGHVYEVDLPPEVTVATDCANLYANKQEKKIFIRVLIGEQDINAFFWRVQSSPYLLDLRFSQLCSPAILHLRFKTTYRLYFQGRSNKDEIGWYFCWKKRYTLLPLPQACRRSRIRWYPYFQSPYVEETNNQANATRNLSIGSLTSFRETVHTTVTALQRLKTSVFNNKPIFMFLQIFRLV